MATDGGQKEDSGTYAAVVATETSIIAVANGKTPDAPEIHSSYQSEAYGLLAGLMLLTGLKASNHLLAEVANTIEVYCDNKTLVNKMNHHQIHKMTLKELQLVHQFRQIQLSNIHVILHHIKGHQDRHQRIELLSRPAQMNVEADAWANKAEIFRPPEYYKFPANSIDLIINNQAITSDHGDIWRKATLSQDLWEYMTKSFKWRSTTPDTVWWKIIGPALDKFRESDRTRIQKLIFKRLPTNHMMNMIDEDIEDVCPECGNDGEDINHLLRCKSPRRQIIREQLVDKFKEYMNNVNH